MQQHQRTDLGAAGEVRACGEVGVKIAMRGTILCFLLIFPENLSLTNDKRPSQEPLTLGARCGCVSVNSY